MTFAFRRSLVLAATGLGLLGTSACAPTQLEGADLPALQALSEEIDQERVWNDLITLAEQHRTDTPRDCTGFPGKSFPELCNLSNKNSGEWLKAQFESFGLPVSMETSTDNDVPNTNIVAELRGTSKPEEIILVGAHFDAFWQGADDNSSGVVAVVELARVLSQYQFDRTIRFVGFDLEEIGIIGSHRYVNAHPNENVVTALVFDCIGFYSDKEGSQQSLPGLPSPSKGNFLAIIANDQSAGEASDLFSLSNELKLMSTVPMIAGGRGTSTLSEPLTRSDHVPFWFADQKALFLTDTANFRNPNYHTEKDTPDTLDKVRMTQAIRLAATALAYWADGMKPRTTPL
ncbi:M28 family peptidase [Archangium lansingense]|uniref:M28 family peptidase n=1 Tax=Archangium lansingense TaxID=2995310 RepID=A0ABT4ACE2_9BACT|nr:M28 family peptidase [Archangium lansinium]MCY1079350.1 M28 family peptidase [Archangium lansinium]